jgi:hypothetical protein
LWGREGGEYVIEVYAVVNGILRENRRALVWTQLIVIFSYCIPFLDHFPLSFWFKNLCVGFTLPTWSTPKLGPPMHMAKKFINNVCRSPHQSTQCHSMNEFLPGRQHQSHSFCGWWRVRVHHKFFCTLIG